MSIIFDGALQFLFTIERSGFRVRAVCDTIIEIHGSPMMLNTSNCHTFVFCIHFMALACEVMVAVRRMNPVLLQWVLLQEKGLMSDWSSSSTMSSSCKRPFYGDIMQSSTCQVDRAGECWTWHSTLQNVYNSSYGTHSK